MIGAQAGSNKPGHGPFKKPMNYYQLWIWYG